MVRGAQRSRSAAWCTRLRLKAAAAFFINFAAISHAAYALDAVPLSPVTGERLPVLMLDRLDPPSGTPARVSLPPAGEGVVVLHFFATWCEPCREELPALADFAANEGGRVVLVDVAEPEARIRRFFETVPVPGPLLMDRDRAASRAYGVDALPASLVLVNGIPRLRAIGPVAWADPKVRAQIRDLVDARPPAPNVQ